LVFVFSWIYTRHYVLLRIIFAIYKDLPHDIEFTWNPSTGQIASRSLWIAFLSLLSALEILLMIWLFMILKVLWKVVRGHAPEDTRSDTESVHYCWLKMRNNEAKKFLIRNRDTDDEAGERKSRSPKIPVACEKQPLLSTTDRPHRAGPRRQQRK
jgi:hypothetical protein